MRIFSAMPLRLRIASFALAMCPALGLSASAQMPGFGRVQVETRASGATFTVSATVPQSSGLPVPTGSVTFQSGQAGFPNFATALNSNGVATSSALQLPGDLYHSGHVPGG